MDIHQHCDLRWPTRRWLVKQESAALRKRQPSFGESSAAARPEIKKWLGNPWLG